MPPADSTSKEMSITFTPGSSIIFFWTRFLPVAAFHVLLRHVSAHDLWLSRLAWRQLQDRLEAFRKKHITDDLDFGSEANLDRNDPTV